MIRLTSFHNNEPVWINPDLSFYVNIAADYKGQKATCVCCSGSTFIQVTESPEEVARKVLEYRLAMERYRIAGTEVIKQKDAQWLFDNAEIGLKQLAGLEEQKDAPETSD